MEGLERLMKGRTVIMITHRLNTIRGADTIIVLHDGVVAEQGTHDELMARDGIYAGLLPDGQRRGAARRGPLSRQERTSHGTLADRPAGRLGRDRFWRPSTARRRRCASRCSCSRIRRCCRRWSRRSGAASRSRSCSIRPGAAASTTTTHRARRSSAPASRSRTPTRRSRSRTRSRWWSTIETAFVQSFNWATKNLTETRDYAVVTTRAHDVEEIIECFEADWHRQDVRRRATQPPGVVSRTRARPDLPVHRRGAAPPVRPERALSGPGDHRAAGPRGAPRREGRT